MAGTDSGTPKRQTQRKVTFICPYRSQGSQASFKHHGRCNVPQSAHSSHGTCSLGHVRPRPIRESYVVLWAPSASLGTLYTYTHDTRLGTRRVCRRRRTVDSTSKSSYTPRATLAASGAPEVASPSPLWARCIRIRTIQGSGRGGFVVVVARWTRPPKVESTTGFRCTGSRSRSLARSRRLTRPRPPPPLPPLRQPTPCSRRPVATESSRARR